MQSAGSDGLFARVLSRGGFMQPDDDLLQVSAQNSLLRNCAAGTREALFRHGSLVTFEPGHKVWGEGEPAGMVLFPLKGKLQLSKTAGNGRRQVFCYLEPGGCSDVCLFLMAERSLADIYAIEASQALVVPCQALVDLSTG